MSNYELIMWDTGGSIISKVSFEAQNQPAAMGYAINLIIGQNKVGLATVTDKSFGLKISEVGQ